jgi:PAS domain S-box-containing protein
MSRLPSEYSIQEASAKLGVPVQKLRRWDSQGVLVARRTEGGHRRYAREIIDGLAGSSLGTLNDKYEDELATARKTLREKRRIIQLLLESESRYRDLVETSHDLIWTTDGEGRFTYLNNGALDIFGMQPKELLDRCFFDFEARPSHFSNRRFLSTLRRHGEVKNYITHLLSADGSDRWVGINARVSHDESGRLSAIRGTARNVTEQHEAALQIEHLATHDALTGLPNRDELVRMVTETRPGSTVPIKVPSGTLVLLDKAYDSDPLRDKLERAGYIPVIPHRKNRVKPSRNDGRRLRRYRHRWRIERTNAWLHCYRALAMRWSHYTFMYVGLVYLSFIHMALQRL